MPIKCHIWTKAIYYTQGLQKGCLVRVPQGLCWAKPLKFDIELQIAINESTINGQPLQMIWSKADMQVILGLRWLPFGPKLHIWGNRTASPRTEYCWSSSRSRRGVSCGDLGARPGCSCSHGIRWCTSASFTSRFIMFSSVIIHFLDRTMRVHVYLEVVFLFISFISHLDGAFWCIL